MTAWNENIDEAPYGKVLEVTNTVMDQPVRATRGYVCRGAVHKDQGFFTSVYTPDEFGGVPAGSLVIPTKWRIFEETT